MQTSKPIPIESFQTAREFLRSLDLSETWVTSESWESPWVFRGQMNSRWGLVPSAWREGSSLLHGQLSRRRSTILARSAEAICRTVISSSGLTVAQAQDVAYSYAQARAETQLLIEFVETADSLGHRVSGIEQYQRLRSYDWLNEVKDYPNYRFLPDPNAATTLAQHHGIPTRLLDWTKNPLIAAYFAAHEVESSDSKSFIAVWAIRPSRLYWHTERSSTFPQHGRFLVHEAPKAENQYLQAQEALFLYPVSGCAHYASKGSWPSLEALSESVAEHHSDPVIKKLVLPHSECGELLRLLWLRGVSKAHLMPTYDNVTAALQIKWRWSTERT